MDIGIRQGMTASQQLMVVGLLLVVLAGLAYIIYVIIKVKEMNHEPVKLPEHQKKDI